MKNSSKIKKIENTHFNFDLPKKDHARFKKYAIKNGISMATLLRQKIKEIIKK